MNQPCETCAFNKPGSSGAASEPVNRLRGEICAMGRIPFFCHHSRSGQEYDWENAKGLGPMQFPPNERKVCAGWQRRVAVLAAEGKFSFGEEVSTEDRKALRQYQRLLASQAFNALEKFIAAPSGSEERTTAQRELGDCVRALR